MVRPGRDQLQGVVEVDEIFIGGRIRNFGFVNAMNGNIYPVKMIFRIDVTLPFLNQNVATISGHSDLLDRRHFRVRRLNINHNEIHRIALPRREKLTRRLPSNK
jgi:hypothetical protein